MDFRRIEKTVKITTILLCVYLVGFGIAMAFFPIRPFWNDEWRLVYNLKFKSLPELWGRLALMQQCPRTYLSALKLVTSPFDYSYTSLRLPALVLSTINIVACFAIKKKVFPKQVVYSNLFILIFISSQTFTDYMTQVKHYHMDIMVTLLALWQLMTLIDMSTNAKTTNNLRYLLLCFSFAVAPYFSYIYPIAIAPVFVLTLISSLWGNNRATGAKKAKHLLYLYFPLALVATSIVIFYIIDVRQLMADNGMYQSYLRMLGNPENKNHFATDCWYLFALVGSGALFEIIFGILGIGAFGYALYVTTQTHIKQYTRTDYLRLYAVLLLLVTIALFLSGKLIGGVARLAVFTVPSISFLIVSLFRDMKYKYGLVKPAHIAVTIVFLGLVGNIITCCINPFTFPEYKNRIKTYWRTSVALKVAREKKLPIMFTEGVRGDLVTEVPPAPGKIKTQTITPEQIAGMDAVCTEVILKVNPEFKVWDTVAVYWMPDMKWTQAYMQQLPTQYHSAIATDGINYVQLSR